MSAASVTTDTTIGSRTPEDWHGLQVLTRASEEKSGRLRKRARPFDSMTRADDPKGKPLTRVMRSHQLWLTLTYFGLLVLMARGIAS
jgi:hypothetical protein